VVPLHTICGSLLMSSTTRTSTTTKRQIQSEGSIMFLLARIQNSTDNQKLDYYLEGIPLIVTPAGEATERGEGSQQEISYSQ
jgi:outer membrane PBP1 activator LpoA protein